MSGTVAYSHFCSGLTSCSAPRRAVTYSTMQTALLGPGGTPIASHVEWARSARARARGLIGRRLPVGHALIFVGARQVHTIGMSYPLDVVFCDREWTVRHVCAGMRSLRISRIVWSARYVIEMPAPSALASLVPGDWVSIRE